MMAGIDRWENEGGAVPPALPADAAASERSIGPSSEVITGPARAGHRPTAPPDRPSAGGARVVPGDPARGLR